MNRSHRAASNRAMRWRTTIGIAALFAARVSVAQADDKKEDLVAAAQIAAQACEKGGETETASAESSAGCRTLARIYEKYPAFIANENVSAALLRDERAFCDGGLITACRNVAFAIEHGIGAPADDAAAAKIYADACVRGNSAACVDARALQILSPNAITGLPELTPSKKISASEKNWADEQVKSAASHLEECANGDADECAAASEYFWTEPSEFCGPPRYNGPGLGAFPDPERALRIA
jgi:TPR repeat protein